MRDLHQQIKNIFRCEKSILKLIISLNTPQKANVHLPSWLLKKK